MTLVLGTQRAKRGPETLLQRSGGLFSRSAEMDPQGSWAAHVHQMEKPLWKNVYWSEEIVSGFFAFWDPNSPTPPSESRDSRRLHSDDGCFIQPLVDQEGHSGAGALLRSTIGFLLPNWRGPKYIPCGLDPGVNASE